MEGLSARFVRVALWNLHLRVKDLPPDTPGMGALRQHLDSAATKLGGDPERPFHGIQALSDAALDPAVLSADERVVVALALKHDRQATGQLHAEHAAEESELLAAFHLIDQYQDIERMFGSGEPPSR